ncbi:MAG TPA: hypothetical protein VKV38_10630 [Trebonia sp.]|jgi:hypothetical protein|nr:hypothetical protein [Trebonia sp.]
MEQAGIERLRQEFDAEVRRRFAGAPIERVEVLQYGDDPEIEPGQLLGRIVIEAPVTTNEGDPGEDTGKEARGRRLEEFHDAHRAAIRELRRELDKLPSTAILEFAIAGEPAEGERRGPRLRLAGSPRALAGGGEGPFTPVMARLGPDDLETLDTLITAGIASSRAEAVRWALARIRERPAYEELRAHTRQIEELKAQF